MNTKITRRQFLKVGGAASAALLVGYAVFRSFKESPTEFELVEKRVDALVDKMSLDEKIQTVHGAEPGEVSVGYIPPIPRLAVPGLWLTDGPVGIRFPGSATAFPATIAMAATWDRDLARDEGVALGSEAKAQDQDVLLAPALNIDRVPLNGRTFEYYSEDPYLTSRIAVEVTLGIQSEGIIATAKHYAANNQETDRTEASAKISERALREVYLPGFEAVVKEAGAGSMMAAYNKLNGSYCTENEEILTRILKDEWGFEGFVVSDWGATQSTVPAANAGLDLEMPLGTYFGDDLRQAVVNGEVSMMALDDKVRRILRQMVLSGALDGRKNGGPSDANTSSHQELARLIAANGIVLLKQQGSTLPLNQEEIRSIAVIGLGADIAKVGGGGSSEVRPPYSVSPLEGIQQRAGSEISVEYAGGEGGLHPVPSSALTPPGATKGEHGLRGEYFSNAEFSGVPTLVRADEQVDFDPGFGLLAQEISSDNFSVRWTGTLTAPTSGRYTLALTSDDGSYLYLDGELVIDNGSEHAAQTRSYEAELDAEQPRRIRIDYSEITGAASVVFAWRAPIDYELLNQAVKLARRTDVAIVIATDDSKEGVDRDSLELPYGQNELISAVAEISKHMVVVLRTGGPVLMPWIEEVPNVLEAWYPGMEEGNAIASVLFGDVNPSGKLPVTFGERPEDYPANTLEQYPGVARVVDYLEDVFVGYRHFDKQDIEPLFAFGHGLSYTSFVYENLYIEPKQVSQEETDSNNDSAPSLIPTVEVGADVLNNGSRQGAEVVQLYLGFPEIEVPMPSKQLKGFQKVFLEPDETKYVSFSLDERALSYWDTTTGDWVVQKGTYYVMVGSSSRDIRLEGSFVVQH